MERKEDKNDETTSEEEEEVPGTFACSQQNENSGIADATCSSPNGNGVIFRNDDRNRDEGFLRLKSHIRDYAETPSSATSLYASGADSSAVSDLDEPFGIGMRSLESDPFLCSSVMSISCNEDTLSTTESPACEPGKTASHLFETASWQVLPEAQLNLSLDNNNPPNFPDCSSPGESINSDQFLQQTQDSNLLVVSDDRARHRSFRSSIASTVGCRSNPSSELLIQTQDSNSLVVSDDQTPTIRRRSTRSITTPVRYRNDPSEQLLPQKQDKSLVVSDDSPTRRRPRRSRARGVRSLTCNGPDKFDLHMRSDDRLGVYLCIRCKCGKACPRLENMHSDLLAYSASNSFVCEMRGCDRIFTDISQFRSHISIHDGGLP